MAAQLVFSKIPPQFGPVTGALVDNADGTCTATVTFAPSGGTEDRLMSGTDVVLVLDCSFSMFAGFYRSAKILDFVDSVVSFVLPYDDDGIDVYLHSLKAEPFKHLGVFTSASEVSAQLGAYMEAGSAMREMGQKTICAPALRDIARRLKDDKKSERVFVEIITDGAFDDKEDLEAAIVELGMKYNSAENPFGLRIHFTGLGAGGAKAAEFLQQLDDGLEAKYPGYIDCVDYDAANDVQSNVASITKELKHSVRLKTENAMLTVSAGGDGDPTHICEAAVNEWQDGGTLSFEGLPAEVSVHAIFPKRPARLRVDLTYLDAETGAAHELGLDAAQG